MISRKKKIQISFRMAVHTPNFSVTLEFLNEQSNFMITHAKIPLKNGVHISFTIGFYWDLFDKRLSQDILVKYNTSLYNK